MILELIIKLDLVRQCPVCWRFLWLWSSNWVSSKSHQFHANNGVDHKCKRLLWFKNLHMQLPKDFWCKIKSYSINLKAVEAFTSLRVVFFSSSLLERHRVPWSTALGQCRTQVLCRGAEVPLPVAAAVPQGPAMNRHLRHSTHGETKHICWYLLSASLLTAKYFPVGCGETTSQRSVASLLSSTHHLN